MDLRATTGQSRIVVQADISVLQFNNVRKYQRNESMERSTDMKPLTKDATCDACAMTADHIEGLTHKPDCPWVLAQ